jgi:glycerol uptake facilitator-like aquaporin
MADSTPTYTNRFLAEVFGTFVLVFGVGGAALFATIFGSSQRQQRPATRPLNPMDYCKRRNCFVYSFIYYIPYLLFYLLSF